MWTPSLTGNYDGYHEEMQLLLSQTTETQCRLTGKSTRRIHLKGHIWLWRQHLAPRQTMKTAGARNRHSQTTQRIPIMEKFRIVVRKRIGYRIAKVKSWTTCSVQNVKETFAVRLTVNVIQLVLQNRFGWTGIFTPQLMDSLEVLDLPFSEKLFTICSLKQTLTQLLVLWIWLMYPFHNLDVRIWKIHLMDTVMVRTQRILNVVLLHGSIAKKTWKHLAVMKQLFMLLILTLTLDLVQPQSQPQFLLKSV